jgi:acyl-CoA synthetase (AMP-forming)/AMP-acid ligase II/thioesterase domain-containing protein
LELQTIAQAIADRAESGPDRPAIVCGEFLPFSFRELDLKIKQIGEVLSGAGVGASSRIGVMLPHGPEAIMIAVAVSAHSIGFPLNPTLSAAEFEFEVARAGLDAIVLPDWVNLPAAGTVRTRSVGIFFASRATTSLVEIDLKLVVELPSTRRRLGAPSLHSVSVIQTSSGSTGTPKLILVTHANLFDVADKMRTWFGLSPADRCACLLPVYSGFGFKIAVVAPLLIGSSVSLTKSQQPEDIAAWISDLHPSWFVATPTYLHAALDKLRDASNVQTPYSLRFFASTSAYLPEAVLTGLEAILRIPGLEFYGLREAGIVAANPAPPATRRAGSVGLVSSDVAILGSDGEALPRGAAGAIAVRGRGVSPGYIDALPTGCDTVVNSNKSQSEWKLTGDLGVIDGDGFLSIVGRMKEIINRGGEKISPYEVEKALLQHPAVREAGAFAVPHPRLGENVAAVVVLQPNAETTPADLRAFLRAHLAAVKIPPRIDIVNSIPKGDTGKISRTRLAEDTANRDHHIDPPEHPLEFQITEIWQRLLQRANIGIHDDFFEAGGDSLLATQMLLEVEEISQSALAEASTIHQLATIAVMEAGDGDELVTKAKDGAGTPFFFCHGDFATRGFYALKLAALLDPDLPVYLIHPKRHPDEATELIIEDMARPYVSRLLELHPSGNFRLGGYCNGGLLAWEIAHQLARSGRRVDEVVLVNSLSLNSRRLFRFLHRVVHGTFTPWARTSKSRLRRLVMRVAWDWARRAQGSVIGWFAQAFLSVRNQLVRQDRATRGSPFAKYGALYYRAMANYIPPELDCVIVAITCEGDANFFEWSAGSWARLARDVHHAIVPGDHMTSITVHVGALAQSLNVASARNSRSGSA